MTRILITLAVLFPLLGTPAQAQTLTDEGRLTTVDVGIITMHAIQAVNCPGKEGCFRETNQVLADLRALRVRMEKFFKSIRLEAERLGINAEIKRIDNEFKRIERKYTPRTRDIA